MRDALITKAADTTPTAFRRRGCFTVAEKDQVGNEYQVR